MGIFSNLFKAPARRSVSQETERLIRHEFEQIELLVKHQKPSQLRQALIKADKCLDNALRDVVPGETMGERLKAAKDKYNYNTYDKIWKAHKMRNSLVHEAGYEPPYHMVLSGIDTLKKGITDLGIDL